MSTAGTDKTVPSFRESERETVELHVKRVPRAIWLKARQQALAQNVSFRDFVIRLLEACDLFRP